MKPVYLYVKQHDITKIMYFGKTTRDDVVSYLGSGIRWTNHIKKHGVEHVKTLWISKPFTDTDDLIEFAQFFSEEFDIVNSDKWANLVMENGVTGGAIRTGAILTESTKQKIREKSLGRVVTEKTRHKMSLAHVGKRQTEKQREAMRNYNKSRVLPKLECPHCFKTGSYVAMHRWHFDNCRSKEN